MRCWLTTQYPPREREEAPHIGIWLEHAAREAALGMAAGDRVLVYQLQGGPVRKDPDGPNPCLPGRQGIVLHGETTEGLTHFGDEPQRFDDGRTRRWCCGARLDRKTLDDGGFVPLRRVNVILGYKPTYNLRFIGKGGVKELTPAQYDALVAEFERGRARRG